MSKELTPIQETMELLEQYLKIFPKEAILEDCITYTKPLLEKEKQFAKDAYNAGLMSLTKGLEALNTDKIPPTFEEYYKKYEQ